MGLLSKPLACQIPAETLTITPHKLHCFPTLRKVRKEKLKYQPLRLAVGSHINDQPALLMQRLELVTQCGHQSC